MHCLEVWTSSAEYSGTVHMFLASLPHGLRELWIESTTPPHLDGRSTPPCYTELVIGHQGTLYQGTGGDKFDKRGWSTNFDTDLRNALHGLRKSKCAAEPNVP